MRKIIYRKSNLQCVGVIDTGTTFEWQLQYNIIPNYGGVPEDYSLFETDKEESFHLEIINNIVTAIDNTIISSPQPVKANTMQIMQAQSTTEPVNSIEDASTVWNVTLVRNVTQANGIYSYEYVVIPVLKSFGTSSDVMALIVQKKDKIFYDIEYPIGQIYDGTTNSTDLLKLIFSLMDTNDSLTSRIAALEAK